MIRRRSNLLKEMWFMRSLSLSAALIGTLLAWPAAAQSPPVRTLTPQGVPAGTNPETGARPGNEVGTGMSEPMSNRASNIDQFDTRSSIAPNLPGPGLGPDASPADYLRAAQSALAAGRTGETQQALEMAQTRMLDRSVAYGQTSTPSDNPAVAQVSQALRALAARDRNGCMAAIQSALNMAR
jgi:hypothetical protein